MGAGSVFDGRGERGVTHELHGIPLVVEMDARAHSPRQSHAGAREDSAAVEHLAKAVDTKMERALAHIDPHVDACAVVARGQLVLLEQRPLVEHLHEASLLVVTPRLVNRLTSVIAQARIV